MLTDLVEAFGYTGDLWGLQQLTVTDAGRSVVSSCFSSCSSVCCTGFHLLACNF